MSRGAERVGANAVLAQTSTPVCGPTGDRSVLCEAVYDATGNRVLAEGVDLFVVTPFRILLILAVAWLLTRILRRLIKRMVDGMQGERAERSFLIFRKRAPKLLVDTAPVLTLRRSQRAATLGALLRSIGAFAIWTFAVLMALGELGLNLGPLIAGAGIVGVALGFGAQNLVRDFISGVFMLIEDAYGVGDVIDAGPASGVVEAVSLRTTRLRDVNGTVWHIPNGEIQRVGNMSQQWARALLDVSVAYGTDIAHAVDVIKRVADELRHDPDFAPDVLEEPEVWGVEMLTADGVTIRLVVKTRPLQQWRVARELRKRIKQTFDREGIEIPFPQRTVWFRAGQGDGEDGGRDGAGDRQVPANRSTTGPNASNASP